MLRQQIYLSYWDWFCTIYYEAEPDDAYEILHKLEDVGADNESLRDAADNLFSSKLNRGLTYSNYHIRESVVVLSKTTSAAEFFDTFVHESGHVVMHISQALHIKVYGEEYQYLRGTLAKMMFSFAKHLMCDECRSHEKTKSAT